MGFAPENAAEKGKNKKKYGYILPSDHIPTMKTIE